MLFEKLHGFNFACKKKQGLIKTFASFDFESLRVPSEEVKLTETITWIGKHKPNSVSF